MRVAWSTAGLIALNVPLNSRPGNSVGRDADREVVGDFPKILLRQRKIDEDVIERLQRNERIASRDHLPGIDRADARHAIEWSVDFLLVDYRLHVIDHRFFLRVFRFGRVELGFGNYLAIREIARPLKVGLGQLGVSLSGAQLRDFRGSVELQKEIAFLDRLARFKTDLGDHAGNFCADYGALHRRDGTDCAQNRLPISLLDDRARDRRRWRDHLFAGGDHGENLKNLDSAEQEETGRRDRARPRRSGPSGCVSLVRDERSRLSDGKEV